MATDPGGVVTVAGHTFSANFPTTPGAFDRTYNGRQNSEVFVFRLDPRRSGIAQLVYSTYLGESEISRFNRTQAHGHLRHPE